MIRIAFRLGVLVDEVSQNLQPRSLEDGPGDSWAYVVPDLSAEDAQKELDAIHAAEVSKPGNPTPLSPEVNTDAGLFKKISGPNKVFISALSRTTVTVSGPPARLKHIFHMSDFFRDRRSVVLPVYGGLCHAAHIYNEEHVHRIVQTCALEARFVPRVPVFSTSKGKPFAARSATSLFESIIEEILTQPIQWDKVIDGVVERTKELADSECQVLTFRNSMPAKDLVETLKTEPQNCKTTTKDLMSWINKPTGPSKGPRDVRQSKIAIVGMSCRMPGGATDTEKFWDILNQGLDVHQKIPADRFDVDSHYDPTGKRMNTSHTPYGCFIDAPGLFDAPFFNMSPREALQTDPMQRLAIVTAFEALERSGYVANRTASTDLHRIGTFYGQ